MKAAMRTGVDPARLAASNAALAIFGPGYGLHLEFTGRRAFVCWESKWEGRQRVQWVTHAGNDFYPTWRKGPWGGTCSTAMSQLIRWCQGKPVLPLGCWKGWSGDGVRLAGDRGPELIELLRAAGYPERVACVCCGLPPIGLDWFNRDGVSGPCCRGPVCLHRPEEAARIRADLLRAEQASSGKDGGE
jgi:hypothetical protein